MKKNKIFLKLFSMTAGVVLIILLLQFVFQYFKLEEFYVYNKKKSITQAMTSLKDNIENNSGNEEKIENYLKQASIENDIYIGVFNRYGIPQYGVNDEKNIAYIEVGDDEGEIYKVYIDTLLYNERFSESLDMGKIINLKGLFLNYGENGIFPITITIEDEEFSDEGVNLDSFIEGEVNIYYPEVNLAEKLEVGVDFSYPDMSSEGISEDGMNATYPEVDRVFIDGGTIISDVGSLEIIQPEEINLEGTIININLPEQENYNTEYRKDQLLQEMFWLLGEKNTLNSVFNSNDMIQYSKEDKYTGMKNLVFIEPIQIENKDPMIIFAISSLQPIKETTEIMKSYFLFILIAAMILAIIVSYFYSKKITTPLLHLNNVTKTMTKLDFSQKCEVYSNDEIGDLGENINIMSDTLQKALDEVKGSNEKLREDILVKEKLDQFRKGFIADASHELKTPLTVMKGICEGIIDGVYDYKDSEHINNILSEINDMSGLVYDLLESSKLEEFEGTYEKDIFQLSDVALKIHSKLKNIVENKNLRIFLELSEDFVVGDENMIERVISNLYYNAIQYTPQNGEIKICMKSENDKCNFIIENSPAKISEEDLSKIWDPFYRVEKSRNKTLGGSGLGLYIAKRILDKHGSEYEIKNTLSGVKVQFSLQTKSEL